MKKNILSFIYKIFAFSFLFKILFITSSLEVNAEDNFDVWLSSYKKFALRKGVSQETLDIEPAETSEITESAETAETEPTEPTESAKPAEPAKSAEPA